MYCLFLGIRAEMSKSLIDPSCLKVIPIKSIEDQELARDLMARHHYLGDISMRCKRIMYLASYRGEWVSVLYVTEATLKLSLRDKELFGWSKVSKGINKLDKETGEYYKTHPKNYLVKGLSPDSIKALSAVSPYTHPLLTGRQKVKKDSSDNEKYLNPNDLNLKSLREELSRLQDERTLKGKMYDKSSVLALCVASILAGKNNYYQMHEWIKGIGRELRKQAGIKYGRCPSMSSIRRMVQSVDNQVLTEIVTNWLKGDRRTKHLIFDGKAVRSAGGKNS